MADDPNRDILPVREGSCVDTYRSSIDPRERHLVCKLDRYQLEDKYLRLLDEAYNLKKSYNCQEDKLKKLGTKLMRVSANPRSFTNALDVSDEKNKIALLESENSKLKDKLATLRSQLLNHTLSGRSCSRGRRPQTGASSGPATCRSEIVRPKVSSCQCIARPEESDSQNHLAKIEELEMQRKDMALRIGQLEKELATHEAGNQREKASENVEYIRVWRQMKQLNEKLIAAQGTNETLRAQISELKMVLEETTKNNQEITASLVSEKKRMSEIDEQLLKSRDSQLTIREKDEQIRDLMSELRIMQQHNNELIALSSRYGQVEMENRELKKKISEQKCDQENLKTVFSTERANVAVLQSINEQLMSKLHELQKNIDSLTVQLMSFQSKNGDTELPRPVQSTPSIEKTAAANNEPGEHVVSETEKCRKCCEAYEKILELERALRALKTSGRAATVANVYVQTEKISPARSTRERGTSTGEISTKSSSSLRRETDSPSLRVENALTPRKMLQLLEQVQINSCPETARLGLQELTGGSDLVSSLDMPRHDRTTVHAKRSTDSVEAPKFEENALAYDLSNVMTSGHETLLQSNIDASLILDTVLQAHKKLYRDRHLDVGKKSSTPQAEIKVLRRGCGLKTYCSGVYGSHGHYDCSRIRHVDVAGPAATFIETGEQKLVGECTCNSEKRCLSLTNLDMRCCNTCTSPKSLSSHTINSIRVESRDEETHDALQTTTNVDNENEDSYDADTELQESIKRLNEYRALLRHENNFKTVNDPRTETAQERRSDESLSKRNAIAELGNVESSCSINCPGDCPSFQPNPFPMLITDNQGLLEVHILSLQLSTSAGQILARDGDIRELSVYVSWQILTELARTLPMRCPKLNFNSSHVFRIAELRSFLNYALTECVVFHVNVLRRNAEAWVAGRTKLRIDNILDYPQNKLHHVAPVGSVMPCSLGMTLGQLSLWIRLSCDLQKVENFKKQWGILVQQEYLNNRMSLKTILESRSNEDLDEMTKESRELPLKNKYKMPEGSGGKKESTSLDEFSSGNRTSTSDKEETPKSSPTEHISSITDESLVLANRYRSNAKSRSSSIIAAMDTEEDSSDNEKVFVKETRDGKIKQEDSATKRNGVSQFEKRSVAEFSSQFANHRSANMIVIEVISMSLLEGSSVMKDDEVKILYIEYSFLGYRGEDMETQSLPKSTDEMFYKFKKHFKIDEETHLIERNTFWGMLEGSVDPKIRFTVVSEPLPEETDTKECFDVGYADFNIRDHARRKSEKEIILPITNATNDQRIGTLKIAVWGLDVIRQSVINEEN